MSSDDTNHMPLDESIKSSTEIFEKVFETNDIEAALQVVEPYCQKSLYHSFMKAVGLIVIGISSMEQADLEKASKAVDSFAKLSRKLRKHGMFVKALKMIKTPNYEKYSNLELHAELLHAFYLAMSALMCGLQKDNTYGLIKVAYRLQKFTKNLKACRKILKKRQQWDNDISRQNFEAGVRFANGLKNLAISQIPPKILRLINLLGYKGQESVAFDEINKVAFEIPGAGARMARIFLIAYSFLAKAHVGLGPRDLPKSEEILKKELEQHPDSIVYRGANAKLVQLKGDIDGSIKMFTELLNNNFSRAHKVIWMELMFCHALKCEWNESIKYSELIRKESGKHSPALATYIEAVFRYVKSIDDNDVSMKAKATEMFKSAPDLRIRHLGKTITPEKMAIEFSIRYVKQNEFLILPEMDMLYQANWLTFIKGNEAMISKLMARVDKEVNHFKDDINGNDNAGNYLTAMFYKGALLRQLGKHSEAREALNTVLKHESRLGKENKYILVQSVLELGLTDLEAGEQESAKKWLNQSIHNYSRYLSENYVHMRAYAGLRELGVSTDKDKEDEAKLEQYRKEWLKEMNVEEKSYETLVQTDDKEDETEEK